MKKFFRCLTLACTAFALFAGCAQNAPTESSSDPLVSEAEATQTVTGIELTDGNWIFKSVYQQKATDGEEENVQILYVEFTVSGTTMTPTKGIDTIEATIPDELTDAELEYAIKTVEEQGYKVSKNGKTLTATKELTEEELKEVARPFITEAITGGFTDGTTIKANSEKTKYLITYEYSHDSFTTSATVSLAKK